MVFEHTVDGGHLYYVSFLQAGNVIQNQQELLAALKGKSVFTSIKRAIFINIFIITLLISLHYSQ